MCISSSCNIARLIGFNFSCSMLAKLTCSLSSYSSYKALSRRRGLLSYSLSFKSSSISFSHFRFQRSIFFCSEASLSFFMIRFFILIISKCFFGYFLATGESVFSLLFDGLFSSSAEMMLADGDLGWIISLPRREFSGSTGTMTTLTLDLSIEPASACRLRYFLNAWSAS